MKTLFNITTSEDDLQRFESAKDLEDMLIPHYDGVELMYYGEDEKEIITKDKVVGYHMHFFPFWLDFWKGNEERLIKEFDTKENWELYYGGSTKEAVICRYKEDLKYAHLYGAEYVVFHVSEASIEESFTWNYHYSDEEVIDATTELLNELFAEEDGSIALLMENLWWQGLTFTDPQLTKRLLSGVEYNNKGIMLDIGHLMHTNKDLQSWQQAAEYIHKMLDMHSDVLDYVKGVHLHGTLEGEFAKQFYKENIEIKADFWERFAQSYEYVNRVDAHKPFADYSVKGIIEKISPDYLVYELQDKTMEERKISVKEQNRYMQR